MLFLKVDLKTIFYRLYCTVSAYLYCSLLYEKLDINYLYLRVTFNIPTRVLFHGKINSKLIPLMKTKESSFEVYDQST